MSRRHSDLVAAAALLLAGLAALWWSAYWPMGTLRLLGPGAMPALASLLIVIPMAVLLARKLMQPRVPAEIVEHDNGAAGGWLRIAVSVAALLVYAAALRPVGFLAATVVLMMGLYALVAPRRKLRSALIAGVPVAVATYVLFDLVLRVPLPGGTVWGG